MTAIELLENIGAIADNDEPYDGHGFPKIKKLADQALALLREECEWKKDEEGMWETGCGRTWEFIDDGPKENRVNYCFNCGKRIKETR